MDESEIKKQVDAFVALPRAERREKFPTLPSAVQRRVRKVIESRRGIAFRMEGGVIVRTKDDIIRLLVQRQEKLNVLPLRMQVLKSKMVELKRQLQEHYGDEALAEAEAALEALPAPAASDAEDNA